MLKIVSQWNWKRPGGLLKPSVDTTMLFDVPGVLPEHTRRILVLIEPEAMYHLRDYAIQHANMYAYILTYDEEVLKSCSNARFYVYGTTWTYRHEWEAMNTSAKQFAVSCVVGSKRVTDGHVFRQELYRKQHKCPIPNTFFVGQSASLPRPRENPDLGERKNALFATFQYSFVIENSRQANYFTEKLCDCLITKTIPIYYGCPNIAKFFDTTGWIILDTPNPATAFNKLAALTPTHYAEHLAVIEKNFETVQQYLDVDENLNRALREIPDY